MSCLPTVEGIPGAAPRDARDAEIERLKIALSGAVRERDRQIDRGSELVAYGNKQFARAERLEASVENAIKALQEIANIPNAMSGSDWDEIETAREIARAALAQVKGETK